MLDDTGVISLEVVVVPCKNVDILLHQVDVSLSCFRRKVPGQPDELWFGWHPDVHLFDLVAVWDQLWLLRDVALVEDSF